MEQEVNSYLQQLLTDIKPYKLTPDEQKKADRNKAGFIMDKLMRKEFRRRISEETRKATTEKIIAQVKANQPICLVIPFGGYKHFWNQSHPEPDWAELFHFRWMTDYVLPILTVYEPGITLEYVSEDLILPRMNNYPEKALESYTSTFREIIQWYQQYTPANLDIRFWRVSDRHDKQAIIKKVESLLPERKVIFDKLSPGRQEQELHRSQRSVFWNGKNDLTNLTEQQKHDRIIESRIIELAFYDTEGSPEFVGEYYWQDNRICICFSFGLSPDNDEFGDLTIKSAPGSSVDYWIGRGIVKSHENKLYDTIVSCQQYADLRSQLSAIKVNSIKLPFKNYSSIEVNVSGPAAQG